MYGSPAKNWAHRILPFKITQGSDLLQLSFARKFLKCFLCIHCFSFHEFSIKMFEFPYRTMSHLNLNVTLSDSSRDVVCRTYSKEYLTVVHKNIKFKQELKSDRT